MTVIRESSLPTTKRRSSRRSWILVGLVFGAIPSFYAWLFLIDPDVPEPWDFRPRVAPQGVGNPWQPLQDHWPNMAEVCQRYSFSNKTYMGLRSRVHRYLPDHRDPWIGSSAGARAFVRSKIDRSLAYTGYQQLLELGPQLREELQQSGALSRRGWSPLEPEFPGLYAIAPPSLRWIGLAMWADGDDRALHDFLRFELWFLVDLAAGQESPKWLMIHLENWAEWFSTLLEAGLLDNRLWEWERWLDEIPEGAEFWRYAIRFVLDETRLVLSHPNVTSDYCLRWIQSPYPPNHERDLAQLERPSFSRFQPHRTLRRFQEICTTLEQNPNIPPELSAAPFSALSFDPFADPIVEGRFHRLLIHWSARREFESALLLAKMRSAIRIDESTTGVVRPIHEWGDRRLEQALEQAGMEGHWGEGGLERGILHLRYLSTVNLTTLGMREVVVELRGPPPPLLSDQLRY